MHSVDKQLDEFVQSYNHKSYEAYETFGFIRLSFYFFELTTGQQKSTV